LQARKGLSMSKNVYVGNLSFNTTADDLREAFAKHGTVTSAQVTTDRETGRSRGFGFVEMSDGGDEAIAALNGTQMDGRTLTVNEAKPREARGPRSDGTRSYGGGNPGSGGGYGGGRRY
jgi:RNA recognition motif-containing protein